MPHLYCNRALSCSRNIIAVSTSYLHLSPTGSAPLSPDLDPTPCHDLRLMVVCYLCQVINLLEPLHVALDKAEYFANSPQVTGECTSFRYVFKHPCSNSTSIRSYGRGKSGHGSATMIDMLPDDVLLDIFDFCRIIEQTFQKLTFPWK